MDDATHDDSTDPGAPHAPQAGTAVCGQNNDGKARRARRQDDNTTEITDLLLAWSEGNQDARDRLMLHMQEELAAMARGRLVREKRGVTVETLDVVQDLMVRLLDRNSVSWKSSAQFRGTASEMMRDILVDHARRRRAKKRDPGKEPIPLDLAGDVAEERADYLIALDDALAELEKSYPEQYEVIVRHYFGGQTRVEIAADMNIPEIRANRHLRAGRAFLREMMEK